MGSSALVQNGNFGYYSYLQNKQHYLHPEGAKMKTKTNVKAGPGGDWMGAIGKGLRKR
jgi:hypothetical protein